MIAMRNENGVTVLNWKDKLNVFTLSTKHGLEMTKVQKQNKITLKPRMVTFYNANKKSVD